MSREVGRIEGRPGHMVSVVRFCGPGGEQMTQLQVRGETLCGVDALSWTHLNRKQVKKLRKILKGCVS